jgi:hypothetical protein
LKKPVTNKKVESDLVNNDPTKKTPPACLTNYYLVLSSKAPPERLIISISALLRHFSIPCSTTF